MKRILLLILGYYLVIQAGIGALSICSQPELTVYLLPLSGLLGWGGHKLIQKAKSLHKPKTVVIYNRDIAQQKTDRLSKD